MRNKEQFERDLYSLLQAAMNSQLAQTKAWYQPQSYASSRELVEDLYKMFKYRWTPKE